LADVDHAASDPSSGAAMPQQTTIPELFAAAAAAHPQRPALSVLRGGERIQWSYAAAASAVEALAQAFFERGLRPGDRLALFGPNSPEWLLVDLAAQRLGLLPVPIYASSPASQAAGILVDSGARVCFTGSDEARLRLDEAQRQGLELDWRPRLDGGPEQPESVAALAARPVLPEVALQIAALRATASPEDTVTLIYTSGTTGEPKGAMLSHANWLHQFGVLDRLFEFGPEDRSLCFLPLAHVFERSWSHYVLAKGAENVVVEDPQTVPEALRRERPTVLSSVPRLYEKIHQAVLEKVGAAPRLRRALFAWALDTGRRFQQAGLQGDRAGAGLRLQHRIADRLVLAKLRAAVGGDKKFMAAGGAHLSREIEEFFHAAGLLVCQGYGLTETSPMVSCNRPGELRFGSVGRPVPGCEVRLDPSTAEIQVRGPNVFQGYWNRPLETAAAFTPDGWLRTGDVGALDDDGYLRITDRIKELIVTSQGKNIAPQRVETLLGRDPFIEQVATVGDGRKCLTALVVPVYEKLEAWAREHGLVFDGREALLRAPEVIELIRRRIEEQSRELARHEMVKRFALLPELFSEAAGTLTPTLKLRRREILTRYQALIDEMYTSLDSPAYRT
jgi:long-chain acyl-CoA synthetase